MVSRYHLFQLQLKQVFYPLPRESPPMTEKTRRMIHLLLRSESGLFLIPVLQLLAAAVWCPLFVAVLAAAAALLFSWRPYEFSASFASPPRHLALIALL